MTPDVCDPVVCDNEKKAFSSMTRIGKLRWMGLDEEAETLLAALSRLKPCAVILRGPSDKD